MNQPKTILKEEHRALVKEIVLLFHKSYNRQELALTKEQAVGILSQMGHNVSERTFRLMMEHIRRNDTCRKYLLKYHGIAKPAFIVSGNPGFWWTEDVEEMKTFWESQHGRICEIMMNAHSLYKLFGWDERQLELFTNAV